MDFGWAPAISSQTATYPHAGQTDVPTSFDGARERPAPPAPPRGWPSGYPATLYASGLTVGSHTLSIDADPTPVPHVWLAPGAADILANEFVLYAHQPLRPQTRYRVVVEGERAGAPVRLDWTFTTR
jgi:hypothetical protein